MICAAMPTSQRGTASGPGRRVWRLFQAATNTCWVGGLGLGLVLVLQAAEGECARAGPAPVGLGEGVAVASDEAVGHVVRPVRDVLGRPQDFTIGAGEHCVRQESSYTMGVSCGTRDGPHPLHGRCSTRARP